MPCFKLSASWPRSPRGSAADGPQDARALHAMAAGQRQQYGKALMLDERPVPAHCTSGQRQPASIPQLHCMRIVCSAALWRRPLVPIPDFPDVSVWEELGWRALRQAHKSVPHTLHAVLGAAESAACNSI